MNVVHVVGSGTIGEPLIGILSDYKKELGIDEVTFHKRTPLEDERSKVDSLVRRGAILAVDNDRHDEFKALGHQPMLETNEAISAATVVIDCTPAGNENKKKYYNKTLGPKGYLAQGSEKGFGKPYAVGINDEAFISGDDKFIQIVSCNTHNISVIAKTLGYLNNKQNIIEGKFLCMRRANDISQDDNFIPSCEVCNHKDSEFGTHHAKDAHDLFKTINVDLNLWSSAVILPTQYMHTIWFTMLLHEHITIDIAINLLKSNPRIALTKKKTANKVFSFGRDHGYYGRILNQTVIPTDSLICHNNQITGFCFTPQDGNALLSSIAATLWLINPNDVWERMRPLYPYLFSEI